MVFPFDNLREHERIEVLFGSQIIFGEKTLVCEIKDISSGGARVMAAWALPRGEEVVLQIEKAGDFKASVAWVRNGELGLKFNDDPERIANLMMGIATYGGN